MNKLIIITVLIVLFLIPASVFAVNDIKILNSTTKIDYPNSLTFNIKAESSSPIIRVRLLYKVDKMTYAPVFAEAWPEFTREKSVSTSWTWDMRKGSLPPGATVTYSWVIENGLGNKLETPEEKLTFEDTRYKWQKVARDKVNIYWYQGNRSFADELLKASQDALSRLAQDTGATLENPVSFYIYANYKDLRGSLVAPEEWTGGVAYAGFNIISIGIAPSNLEWGKKAVAHELGHLVTHQISFSPYGADLPPWLDEGLAMHAEGQQSQEDRDALVKAIEIGRISTLRSLSSPFSADAEEAYYAYAQSQSVIEFLINKYSKDNINNLLLLLKDGNTMDEALIKIYGFDLSGLDEAWIQFMMADSLHETAGETAVYRYITMAGQISSHQLASDLSFLSVL
ncbi:MAG: peptidase MA family metallohydrolase [Dehalococcoidia bacterium]|nr:peptidase MA family metallohydrolase [Dehalococcoidia bacterium]